MTHLINTYDMKNCIVCKTNQVSDKDHNLCMWCFDVYRNAKVRDVQMMCSKDTPKELRKKRDVGDIRDNTVQCSYCEDKIRSRNRHDYVKCKCWKTFVDWGSHYCRTTPDSISHTELFDDVSDSTTRRFHS